VFELLISNELFSGNDMLTSDMHRLKFKIIGQLLTILWEVYLMLYG